MNNVVQQGYQFLRHRFKAGDEHSVHSPFVFKLLTEALYKKNQDKIFDSIESIRKNYSADQTVIDVTDLGAGSSYDGRKIKRTVAEIITKFAKAPHHGRFLSRMVSFHKPEIMIELGTSLGISSMYLAGANPSGKLYTIEGCPNTAAMAKSGFNKNGFQNIESITGNFDIALPDLLFRLKTFDIAYIDGNHTHDATIRYFQLFKAHRNKNSIIIFDDIYWSTGMQQAWEEIKKDDAVTITLDFFQFGVVYFNTSFSKQNFLLRM